ncbi:MAG TPA: hypothetical protein VE079_15760 [Ensifer sp.]|nr:hypothetical protein [Ensifer sp.]
MSRQADVFEKLDYADQKGNELFDLIFTSGSENRTAKFIGSIAGDVLSSNREALDYIASDIVDQCIVPFDQDTANNRTKIKCYYPLYKAQLTKPSAVFQKLKAYNLQLHSRLFSIAASIENSVVRADTTLNYKCLRELADMVNQKKHDRLLAVTQKPGSTVYVKNDNIQMMFDLDQQKGINAFHVPDSYQHVLGNNYIFEYNKEYVLDFTMSCRSLTRLIAKDLYGPFLQ